MPTTYKWTIAHLDCHPKHKGKTNVVSTIHWRLGGTDGEHTAEVYGATPVGFDPKAKFTTFDKVTEAQVLGWLHDAMGEEQVAALETAVILQLADMAKPKTVSPTLPWSA